VQEELKALAVAAVCRQIRAAEQERAEIIEEQLRMFEEAGRVARGDFDACQVDGYYEYERYLARQAVDRDATLAQLRQTETARRSELEDAMKGKRIVEKLSERHAKAVYAGILKQEQAATDEAAVNSAAMARQGGHR
jgi:hypothetical protein